MAVLKAIKKSDLCDWANTYMRPGGNFRQLTIQVSGHALHSTAAALPTTEDAVRSFVREHLARPDGAAASQGASPERSQGVRPQPEAAAIEIVNFTGYSSIDAFKSSSTILPVTRITE